MSVSQGPNELSVIERCPYYRGVRRERFHCIPVLSSVILLIQGIPVPLYTARYQSGTRCESKVTTKLILRDMDLETSFIVLNSS